MLPERNRLTKEKEFEKLYKSGKKKSSDNLTIITLPADQNVSRFGFVVSKKQMKKTVSRNRAKRRIRAAVKGLLPQIEPGFDVVIQARKGILQASPTELEQELKKLLAQAKLLKQT